MFRKALVQARAPAGIIQDAFDIKLNNTISQDLKKLKFKVSFVKIDSKND